MKRLVLAVSLALAVVGGGCDDDNDNKPTDAKTDTPLGDAGGDGGAAKCSGTFSSLTRTQLGAATSASGMCAMPKDLDFICTANLAQRSRDCGTSCLVTGSTNIPQCIADCIQQSQDPNLPDLTAGCAGCYRDLFSCTVAKCATCTADPNSAACLSCQQTQGCLPVFFQCSGLPGGTLGGDGGVTDTGADRPPETAPEVGTEVPSSEVGNPDGGADAADATAG
jgi:hypothetical protein